MRAGNRGRGGLSAARLATGALAFGLLLGSPAAAAPEYATPDPNSPAGREYALPLDDARSDATGGSGRDESGGSGGSAPDSSAPLFGAGIVPKSGGSGGEDDSGSPDGGGAGGGGEAKPGATQPPGTTPTKAVVDGAGAADRQVALIVFFVLVGAAGLACLIRFATRRSARGEAD